jgi:membrane protein implicated in regulation of membrane protease activity
MGDGLTLLFFDNWTWLIFVVAGLVMILAELLIGVETGFDLVIIGSILAIAGAVTSFFNSWVVTVVSGSVVCVIYFVAGRRYVHRLRKWQTEIKSGADALIGESGIVTRPITRIADGSVKVRNESFRARADDDIGKDEEIEVTGIKGITLIVKKKEVA